MTHTSILIGFVIITIMNLPLRDEHPYPMPHPVIAQT